VTDASVDSALDTRQYKPYIHCMNDPGHSLPDKTGQGESTETPKLKIDFSALVVQDTRVFKAGNSLAIRIPSAIAKRIELEEGTAVEIAVDDGLMYVRKAPSRALADLIENITPDNVHHSTFDDIVGAERW
jgi:antitoxin MazE